jgi:hypothetical protein
VQADALPQLVDLVLELKLLALQFVELRIVVSGMVLNPIDLFLERLMAAFELDEMGL